MAEEARYGRAAGIGRWLAAWLIFAAITLATILYFSLVFVPAERAAALDLWRGRLSAMADDRKRAITAWLDDRLGQARVRNARVAAVAAVVGRHRAERGRE